MTETGKKWWKLVFIAVPIIISNVGSYLKARAEAQDDNKAAYETLRAAVEELQKRDDEKDAHIYALEGQVSVLKDFCSKTEAKVSLIHPGVHPLMPNVHMPMDVDGDGVPDLKEVAKEPPHKHAPMNALPTDFSDVVQQYKQSAAKK